MPKRKSIDQPVEKSLGKSPTLGGPYASSFELTKERKVQLTKLYRAMRLTRDTESNSATRFTGCSKSRICFS